MQRCSVRWCLPSHEVHGDHSTKYGGRYGGKRPVVHDVLESILFETF